MYFTFVLTSTFLLGGGKLVGKHFSSCFVSLNTLKKFPRLLRLVLFLFCITTLHVLIASGRRGGESGKQYVVLLLQMNEPQEKKRPYEYVPSSEEVSHHVKKGISIPKLI